MLFSNVERSIMDNQEIDNEVDLVSGAELAATLGVTPSRISQVIKKKGLNDKLIKVGNKKLIPKDVNDLLIKYFSSTQQPKTNTDAAGNLPLIEQLRSEIESLKQDKADLRSDLEAEKGTVTQLLASNYNLSNKLAELEAPKEDNEALNTTKDALNETKEELESLRKQLEETTNDLQKERGKSWWAKLTVK